MIWLHAWFFGVLNFRAMNDRVISQTATFAPNQPSLFKTIQAPRPKSVMRIPEVFLTLLLRAA